MNPTGRALWLIAAGLLAGCGAENSLGGSVSSLFPLTVSRVEVLRNPEALQVSYFNNNGADVDLVIRLTVALAGIDLQPGTRIPLEGEYEPEHPRTTVAHQAGGEPERTFGTVQRGALFLDAGGEPEQRTRGSFNLLFAAGDAFGGGRDLTGTFSQVALDAGFDPIIPDAGP